MKKFTAPLILALSLGLFLITLMATVPSQASPNQPTGLLLDGVDIYTNPQMESGILSTHNQSIFGPKLCTSFGDPFSPWNSRYTPGPYSYRYRIMIPPNYPSNVVRVELFDPDSINQSANSQAMYYSQAALYTGEVQGAFPSGSCDNIPGNAGAASQKNACLVPTGEVDTNGTPVGGLDLEQVNPFWFIRIDENRGAGSGDGNGTCGEPGSYSPRYNTETLYQLYYYRDNGDDTTQRVDLSSYIGQTGDGVRDNGGHNTDMQWVSPGAARQSYDYETFFPGSTVNAEPGSRTSFEIDLTTEVPNMITDETTGVRYIYMDITTISGASENGFEIWAGPPNYVDSVPGDVNARNIYVLNNPGSHSSLGVKVFVMGMLPLNSNANYRTEVPLTYISPELAGESIFISLFDPDSGFQPPITFYFDSIAEEDWSQSFAIDPVDPDGVTSNTRCTPGSSCNDKWVEPPYQIKLPNGTQNCDFSNPTGNDCTPFYGGKLMVRYAGGQGENHVWGILGSGGINPNPIGHEGCDAFPITMYEGIRSVNQNTYPPANEFDSTNPPKYNSFIHHEDERPLLQATEGTVFKIYNGFGSGAFGWLNWNTGIIASASTLQDSLTWPGNTHDYTNHEDGGQVLPGQSHVVRGYIEPGDASDTNLHLGDWIAASSGSVNSVGIRNTLQGHIDLGRTLRLPIWNESQGQGSTGAYKASGFALFRIHGFKFSQSGDSWLLLEFIRFDGSCGQPGQPPEPVTSVSSVVIDGTTYTAPNSDETFTASILPLNATQPVSYTWEATDFAPVTHSGGISDTITFNWATVGTKTITVTAVNAGGIVTETHTVTVSDLVQGKDLTIIGAPQLITPLPIDEGDPVTFEVTVRNNGTEDIASHWFVNLFVNPGTINPDGISATESNGFTTLSALDSGESKTVTITLDDGLPTPGTPHQIYAMVDTFKNIAEVNETNNISEALPFGANNFIEWNTLYLPSVLKH